MNTAKRRAKKAALAELHGWRCLLCGAVIDPTPDPTGADPRRASLHHLLPLALGGRHTLTNLALTHASCHERFHAGEWSAIERKTQQEAEAA